MVRDVKQLTEQNGQFLRLFKKGEKNLEAVFSKEPGFLLAEIIREHFGHPENLLVCEALPDGKILLVLIRDGMVHLDVAVTPERVPSELTSMIASQKKYKVFVYGNTPLTGQMVEGKFQLPAQLIEIFQQFNDSLLNQLPASIQFQLLPLPIALKSDYLKSMPRALYFSLCAIVIILLGWWIFHTPTEKTRVEYVMHRATTSMPTYQAYDQALETPYPVDQMKEMGTVLSELAIAPGWVLSQLNFSNNRYTAHFTSQGGDLETLESWAESHRFTMATASSNLTITIPSKLSARVKPTKIYSLDKLVSFLVDDLNNFLENSNGVSVGEKQTEGRASSVELKLNLSSVSPEFLVVLATEVNQLPVVITSVNLSMGDELLNGTMIMTVWGD